MTVTINEETLQDIINIETGLLAPLTGFMGEEDFRGVVDRCRLADGQVFPLPITLDVPPKQFEAIHLGDTLTLTYGGAPVVELRAESKFHMTEGDIEAVFRTLEDAHPGVRKERERWACRVGGPVRLTDRSLLADALKPEDTKRVFEEKGWKTVVGFQTRNPIHKAHEHIQRIGLEVCDGLFINQIGRAHV